MMGLVLLLVINLSAQQDSRATEILDEVSKNTRSFLTISADFSFSMQNIEMEIDEKNEGSIKFKGKMYSVDLPDLGMKVFCDGNTLWNYMKNGNQVTITNLDDEGSDLMNPSSLFNIYEKGFNSKFIAEEKKNGKTVYQIELIPDTDEHGVSKILVAIDKATMMIHSAVLYDMDQTLYGIYVENMVTNKEISDSEFAFDSSKFDDVEEIDLR